MTSLQHRQERIAEKRKNTDFREFLKHLVSWFPIVLYKIDNKISRFPYNNRIGGILDPLDFEEGRELFLEYGFDYDFSNNFFSNFMELLTKVPLGALVQTLEKNENSKYGDIVIGARNSYLNIAVADIQDSAYNYSVFNNCNNLYNNFFVKDNSENIYFSKCVSNSNNVYYSKYINNSYNIYFSTNLIGCKNCIFCDNLENQEYCINNKQYNKEDYEIKKNTLLKRKTEFLYWYKEINDQGTNYLSENTNGKYNIQCKDWFNGYYCSNGINGRNNIIVNAISGNCENMYDVYSGAGFNEHNFYALSGGGNGSNNIYCSAEIVGSSNIYYSYYLKYCSHCIGCVGLKNKSYCILNKQYSKEEWYKMADKIFSQMEENGELGEFFPGWLNPFNFNDTAAYLFDDSFTKEEVEKEGYMRRDESIKVNIPEDLEVVETKDLDNYQGYDKDGNWIIDKDILNKVIKDENGNYYRIIKMEYDFLMRHGLPLPEIHWLDRIKMHVSL